MMQGFPPERLTYAAPDAILMNVVLRFQIDLKGEESGKVDSPAICKDHGSIGRYGGAAEMRIGAAVTA